MYSYVKNFGKVVTKMRCQAENARNLMKTTDSANGIFKMERKPSRFSWIFTEFEKTLKKSLLRAFTPKILII